MKIKITLRDYGVSRFTGSIHTETVNSLLSLMMKLY